jgi:hypothetical protein
MMSKTGLLFLTLVMTFGPALAPAQETDISGGWELTIQSPRGPVTIDVRFVQEGQKLSVIMIAPRGRESNGEGSIQGQAVQWSIERSTDRGERTVVYKGTVTGAAMSGTADLGDMGSVSWTAARK